jgi:hypothetical protein
MRMSTERCKNATIHEGLYLEGMVVAALMYSPTVRSVQLITPKPTKNAP